MFLIIRAFEVPDCELLKTSEAAEGFGKRLKDRVTILRLSFYTSALSVTCLLSHQQTLQVKQLFSGSLQVR